MTTINTKGMHCTACEILITDVLEEVGAKDVIVDYQTGIVTFNTLNEETAKKLIVEEGYEVL